MTPRIKKRGLAEQTALEAPLIQLCFTVGDLDLAARDFSRAIGAGPWYRVAPLSEAEDRTTYRGARSPLGADIILGYAGDTMYELVAPRDGSASIFSEWVSRFGTGLHHFGYATEEFDRGLEGMNLADRESVMSSVTARGARVAMFEGDGPLGALHELIEITSESRRFYDSLRLAARGWTEASGLFTDLTD
ncbi:MAG: VOC family protein [Rhodospirillum sp.]|nr:VOC family protein [Rhodospirillum sp.]